MSSYEFWDELGKIFNAVVAYQEKNIEFNRRFISPWIRLGNVFEKQDRNKEAVEAYQRAIEMDSANPQNWFELGNIHFKMENHTEAVSAFNRALELDPGFGWAYSNLGLTLTKVGEIQQAVELYQRAIELLQDPKDKAVTWNRLGNAYRKLNQYEQALEAFHRADELDLDNAGFRDSLDEVAEGPTLMRAEPDGKNPASAPAKLSPIELIVAENRAAEAKSATAQESTGEGSEAADGDFEFQRKADKRTSALPWEGQPEGAAQGPEIEAQVGTGISGAGAPKDETVAAAMGSNTETFTQTLPISPTGMESRGPNQSSVGEETGMADETTQFSEVVTSEDVPVADGSGLAGTMDAGMTSFAVEEARPAAAVRQGEEEEMAAGAGQEAERDSDGEPDGLDASQRAAYEEYLRDTREAVPGLDSGDGEESELPGSPEPAAKLDQSGDLQIEMDTKNAHVWNELGNMYFNSSAYDDAIVAYSKAIELDRWFAWPYSNLALTYVQKGRFAEAILLYQRSIDLFSSDKDKAVSWNRLGNVYRRLNDYENSIAAYQRADGLDPDNSTLSMQSRFSLLGNYATEQTPSYAA